MADGSPTIDHSGAIPVDQIRRTRQDFPNCALTYQVELECDGPRGLAALAEASASAGFELASLRYFQSGRIFVDLIDDRRGNLELFDDRLRRTAVVLRWTTLIDLNSTETSTSRTE